MPYPVGITTRAVTMGGATALESAEPLILQAIIQSSRGLIWGATGWRFPSLARTVTSTAGGEITVSLPVTDLPGWRLIDAEGSILDVSVPGSYTHTYTVTLIALTAANKIVSQRILGPFVLPTGDGSPVDLDTMLPVGTQAGGAVLVPDSWGALVAQAVAAAGSADAAALSETAAAGSASIAATKAGEAATSAANAAATLAGAVNKSAVPLDHATPPDLDTLPAGYWSQGYASDGTLALHYPSEGWYGNILVTTSGVVTEQRAVRGGGATHTRTKTGGTWTAWVPATPPTGTTAGTYAAGNDSRFLDIPVANLIPNGDFAGVTGWTATGSANSAAGNVLSNTADGTSATPAVRLALPTAFKVGHVMYYRLEARVTNAACSRIWTSPSSGFGGFGGGINVDNPAVNVWHEITHGYVTPSYTTPNTILNFPILHTYADAATANGKVMQVRYALILDLTDIFGDGNEPPLAEMNALLNKYPNRWVGTTPSSLLTIDDMRQGRTDRTSIRPTGDWAAFLEHEFRTSALDARVNPKLFSIDVGNTVYSSTDHGKTWAREATLDLHPTFQVTNMNRRMLLQTPSAAPVRDGRLRIYDLRYRLISELTDIHGIYGCHGMDGKPGDDNTFVYAEYVVGGDATNGVRIMQTTDGGVTWNTALSGTGVTHFHSVRFDPFNRSHVYATSGDADVDFRNRWYKSTDSGATWTLIAGGTIGAGADVGKTPLVGGTWGDSKHLRTTNTVMGANLGAKSRNSVFYFTDNNPCAFMRYDKTLGQFQVIADGLQGVAYGAILTRDGVVTMTESLQSTTYDTVHYIKFPMLDADIDNPAKYEVYTTRMPGTGNKIRQNWSRQQDTAGGMFAGAHSLSNAGVIGSNQLRPNGGIASKLNIGWTSTPLQTATLTIIAPVATSGSVYVWLNGLGYGVPVVAGDTAVQVAGKIRAASFAGYTTGGTGDAATFTSTTPGTILRADYWSMETGAAGLMRDATTQLVVGVEPVMSIS